MAAGEGVPTQDLLTAVCFSDEQATAWPSVTTRSCSTTADAGETWTRTHYAPEAQQPLLDVLCNGDGRHRRGRVRRVLLEHRFRRDLGGAQVRSRSGERAEAAEARRRPRIRTRTSAATSTSESHRRRLRLAPLHRRRSRAPLPLRRRRRHLARAARAIRRIVLRHPAARTDDSLLAYGLRGHLFRSDDAGLDLAAIETNTQAMLNDAVRLPGRRCRGRRSLRRRAEQRRRRRALHRQSAERSQGPVGGVHGTAVRARRLSSSR